MPFGATHSGFGGDRRFPGRPAPADRSPHHSPLQATARRRSPPIVCLPTRAWVRIRHATV